MNNEKFLLSAEKRFKKTCKLMQDISVFPLLSEDIANIKTDKEKSKEFGEVFTPLWLVDQMIEQVIIKNSNVRTLDLCSGYGQFSIRLMRYFYNKFPNWSVAEFIKNNHAFSELQVSSCYKLLNIFGNKITLFIGNSLHLNKLPTNATGLWCYIENYGYWVCLTKTIQGILSPNGIKKKPCSEAIFVASVEKIIKELNEIYSAMKELYNLTAKNLTSESIRLSLIDEINSLDQVDTMEKKSILVLYNCAIVEQLIHKKKIDPKNITFASDFNGVLKSDIMKKMYGVETLSFSSDVAFLHLSFKGRKFDVCLSNPPYNRGLDLKILQALMNKGTVETSIAKEFVWVHPATWLLDQKGKSNTYNNVKTMLNKKLKNVKLFNGNAVFGIELFVPCVVSHMDIGYNNTKINVLLFEEKFSC